MVDQWQERGTNYYVSVEEGYINSEQEGRGRMYEEDNSWIGLGEINSFYFYPVLYEGMDV